VKIKQLAVDTIVFLWPVMPRRLKFWAFWNDSDVDTPKEYRGFLNITGWISTKTRLIFKPIWRKTPKTQRRTKNGLL